MGIFGSLNVAAHAVRGLCRVGALVVRAANSGRAVFCATKRVASSPRPGLVYTPMIIGAVVGRRTLLFTRSAH